MQPLPPGCGACSSDHPGKPTRPANGGLEPAASRLGVVVPEPEFISNLDCDPAIVGNRDEPSRGGRQPGPSPAPASPELREHGGRG